MLNERYHLDLVEKKGFELDQYPTSQDDRPAIEAIISRDYGNGFVTETQGRFVATYFRDRLSQAPLPEEDLALLQLLMRQRAFSLSLANPSQIAKANYAALTKILPDIIDRAHHPVDKEDDFAMWLGDLVAHIPNDQSR